ncbi:hypothetical protein MVEN_02236600 [Mycena venus]|uniref:Uncharacterized protein n=1 Tax=Mycena venus TaxID=2733690 RepID=A0A8H6X885_9AGAR|nr:hypothetical protein MVEN_02236600 [Mycena venus]
MAPASPSLPSSRPQCYPHTPSLSSQQLRPKQSKPSLLMRIRSPTRLLLARVDDEQISRIEDTGRTAAEAYILLKLCQTLHRTALVEELDDVTEKIAALVVTALEEASPKRGGSPTFCATAGVLQADADPKRLQVWLDRYLTDVFDMIRDAAQALPTPPVESESEQDPSREVVLILENIRRRQILFIMPPAPLPARIQDSILSRCDRVTFNVPKVPSLNKQEVWTQTTTQAATRKAYRRLGDKTIRSLLKPLLYALLPEKGPLHTLLLDTLMSARTIARVLLATGDYEDASPSPFFGMDSPSVTDAFLVYVGAFMVGSDEHGLTRLRPWVDRVFRPLAEVGVKAIDERAKFMAPTYPTTRSQLAAPEGRWRKKVKVAPTGRAILCNTTNITPAASCSVPPVAGPSRPGKGAKPPRSVKPKRLAAQSKSKAPAPPLSTPSDLSINKPTSRTPPFPDPAQSD